MSEEQDRDLSPGSPSPGRARSAARPDVIVLEVDSGKRVEYLITEVKYSSQRETVERGIEELLEYLAFLRDDAELVFEDPEVFGTGWNGVLAIRDIGRERTARLDEQRLVKILQASELETELETVVGRLLNDEPTESEPVS